MKNFQPHQGMLLRVDSTTYDFMPHPFHFKEEEVYVLEGGEAIIYQIRDLVANTLLALKVMKQSFRGEHIKHLIKALALYRNIPGLYLANSICLTKETHPELIRTFPDLEYAVVMPWIQWRTWASLMLDPVASAQYTPSQALTLALTTAQVLQNLEAHQLAHTDIAGRNVMVAPDFKGIELLDIEAFYIPNIYIPLQSWGSPGYQHRHLGRRGQWCPEGDRFAGAILLTEMLTWCDPFVRALTPDNAESLFQPHELQEIGGRRWQAVRRALWSICPPVLKLFDHAWTSSELAQAPDFVTWTLSLQSNISDVINEDDERNS